MNRQRTTIDFNIEVFHNRKEFTVRGQSASHAAQIAARKLHGRKASAWRTSGTGQLSGFFQSYIPSSGGGLTSIGEQFHVSY